MTTNLMQSLGLATVGLCAACATPGGSARRAPVVPMRQADVATATELARDGTEDSLLAVLRRFRPLFLGSRGSRPLVSVDGLPLTELSVLESIRVSTVSEVRLVRAPSAADCCRVVLLVTRRAGGGRGGA